MADVSVVHELYVSYDQTPTACGRSRTNWVSWCDSSRRY